MIFLDREISPVFFAITVFPPSQMKIERKSTRIQHVIHGLAKIVAGPTKTHKQTKKRFQFSFVSHSLTRRPSQNGVWASFFYLFSYSSLKWTLWVCVRLTMTHPSTDDGSTPPGGGPSKRKTIETKKSRNQTTTILLHVCCKFLTVYQKPAKSSEIRSRFFQNLDGFYQYKTTRKRKPRYCPNRDQSNQLKSNQFSLFLPQKWNQYDPVERLKFLTVYQKPAKSSEIRSRFFQNLDGFHWNKRKEKLTWIMS